MEVEVRKNGKSLELLVSSGSLLFNVTEPLKEDEKLNICTAAMVAGVRGTTGWVEESAEGSGLAIASVTPEQAAAKQAADETAAAAVEAENQIAGQQPAPSNSSGGSGSGSSGGGSSGDATKIYISDSMVIASRIPDCKGVAAGIGSSDYIWANIERSFVDIRTGTEVTKLFFKRHHDAAVPAGTTLAAPWDYKLTIGSGSKLINNGTIELDGTIRVEDGAEIEIGDIRMGDNGRIVDGDGNPYNPNATALLLLESDETEIPAEPEAPTEQDDAEAFVKPDETEEVKSEETPGEQEEPSEESEDPDDSENPEEPDAFQKQEAPSIDTPVEGQVPPVSNIPEPVSNPKGKVNPKGKK